MKKPSVLIVHNSPSRFVLDDCELLARHCETTVRYEQSPWRVNPFEIWNEIRAHDLVFCWFASWHSLVPTVVARIQGKPSVIVIGGYDVANVPQASYGSQRRGFRKHLARAVMSLATHLLPFSAAAQKEASVNVGIPHNRMSVVHLGVAAQPDAIENNRQHMVLTVGIVCRENLLRKGLLPFVQAARSLPQIHFVHVGPCLDDSIDALKAVASPNVQFLGRVSDETLMGLYQRASVYVQASLHEGFGMSVAEAMAAGCIPVVARCGSLPEVVGDTGIYISSQSPAAIADGITLALRSSDGARLRAQTRIRELFTLSKREKALVELVDGLLFRMSRRSSSPRQVGAWLE